MASGENPDDFAWTGDNLLPLMKWLRAHDIIDANGWLRLLQNRTSCYLHREPNGTITIEEAF